MAVEGARIREERPAASPPQDEGPLARALRQPMTLGLFLPTQKGGWTASAIQRGTDWHFDYNRMLAERAEATGFDLVFALAEWQSKGGMGGKIAFRDGSLESFMTTAALAAVTKRILLISTIHVLYGPLHPYFLAKMGATLDHVSGGRWGLNIVTGSRPEERPMFGLPPIEHDVRYEMISEFADIMTKLWTRDENLDFHGRFWKTKDAYVTPRPCFGRPVMVNAGNSPASTRYAARFSDFLFITSPGGADIEAAVETLPPLNARIREMAEEHGRADQLRTIINPMIICRETDAEAQGAHRRALELGDEEVAAKRMAKGDSVSWRGHTVKHRIVGGNVQLIGSPEHIVEDIIRLKKAGCGGVQITFIDFALELEFFVDRVLPLLKEAGLRLN